MSPCSPLLLSFFLFFSLSLSTLSGLCSCSSPPFRPCSGPSWPAAVMKFSTEGLPRLHVSHSSHAVLLIRRLRSFFYLAQAHLLIRSSSGYL